MRRVFEELYIGSNEDYIKNVKDKAAWSVVHACREPYHREAVGYLGSDAPKSCPERLVARRKNELMLNLVDAAVIIPIPETIFNEAIRFIDERLDAKDRVMIHCMQGISRSASVGFLYLASSKNLFGGLNFEDAEKVFEEIYPPYRPSVAIRAFLKAHWLRYSHRL